MNQVFDAKGNKVPNLFVRGNSLVWRKEILRKTYVRRVPVRQANVNEKSYPSQELIKQAQRWAANEENLILSGDISKRPEELKFRREVGSVKQVIEEYKRVCAERGEPIEKTVRDNCSAITRLIRDAGGKGTDVSVSVLNKDLLVKYRAAKLKELGDNGSTRRTIASTVRQVRSMLAPKVVQEFSVKLPDLTEFRTFSLGKVPRKDVPLPRYELRRKTAVAARELWINRDPLYLVYALGIYLGMRSDEIAFCRWAWIEDNMGQKRMAICDRESEGFHIKGVRPGNVPVHPVVLRRLQAYKGKSDFVLPGNSYTERKNLIGRDFAAWMDKLGWSVLDTTKRAHELRRLFGSKVWVKHGQQECFLRMRHTQYSTTEKNYLNYNLSFKPWELMGI